MEKVTQIVSAWITDVSSIGPQDFIDSEARVLARLHYSDLDMTTVGWTRVGRATITLEMPSVDTLISNKLDALREQAKTIKAEAQAKVTAIEEQINNLLAITYDGGAA